MRYDAVVLAGGRGSRLGGADKAALEVAGRTLLDHALEAVAGAGSVVVVGDPHPTSGPTSRKVRWTREHPPYGGPVAATYAGLDALRQGSPEVVVVLAVDMPGVTEGTVRRVVAAVGEREGAVLTDRPGDGHPDGGRRHLAFAVRAAALERVRPVRTEGAAMRDLWSALDLAAVDAEGEEAHDIDHRSDLPETDDPGS